MPVRYEQMNATIEEVRERIYARDKKMNAKIEEINEKIDKQKDDIITNLTENFEKEVVANKNEICRRN